MVATENKVQFGLKKCHYAVITEAAGKITYGTPVPMLGAVTLSLEPKGETSEFYADDQVFYSTSTNQGYEGTLEIARISEAFRTDVLGEVLETGILTENANAKPKEIALLFEFDGDVKGTRHAVYKCTVSRPNIASGTKTETTEPGTTELTFIASALADGTVKRSTASDVTEEVYNAWYTKVYEPTVAPA